MQPLGTDSAFTTYALLTRQLKRQWWLMLLTLVTLSMLGTSFRHELRLQQFDNVLYDWAIRLQPSATTPSNIAIITIDDDSIAQLGFWPWRRTKHAELLPYLSEAKAVGFDVLFSEANPNFPQDDDAFAQAIGESCFHWLLTRTLRPPYHRFVRLMTPQPLRVTSMCTPIMTGWSDTYNSHKKPTTKRLIHI